MGTEFSLDALVAEDSHARGLALVASACLMLLQGRTEECGRILEAHEAMQGMSVGPDQDDAPGSHIRLGQSRRWLERAIVELRDGVRAVQPESFGSAALLALKNAIAAVEPLEGMRRLQIESACVPVSETQIRVLEA